jgi:pimeloyl-ACP methyl ester carboxylesterase
MRIRISEIGTGKPVLVVPGNTGDVFPLASLLAELQDRRIIAVNRPGGGLSDGMDHRKMDFREQANETITTVLDTFSLAQAPIIAHSIGGHWSLWYAMDHPERVTALALLGVPGNILTTRPPFALRLMAAPGINSLLFKIIEANGSKESLKGLTIVGHSQETLVSLPKELAECYYSFERLPHYQISTLSLMQKINRLSGANPAVHINEAQLHNVRQPTMFLWGTNDPFGSIQTGQKIAACMPHSEFHAIQNGGHLPWLD